MVGDKVIVVLRIRKDKGLIGGTGSWMFYSTYLEDNKQEAKSFVENKNNNNNCKYTYKITTSTVQ